MLTLLKTRRRRRELLTMRRQLAIATETYLRGQILQAREPGTGNRCAHDIVVSLTSFGGRIDTLSLTIESLLQQTLRPDRLLLWLAADNFPQQWRELPASLLRQCERGLEIHFVEGDLGPYKKIVYARARYPDSLLITVDDDLLYPADLVDQFYRNYLQMPDAIHCNRAHRIAFDRRGRVRPYRHWHKPVAPGPAARDIFPTGNAGVLYPPASLHADLTRADLFMQLAPGADDIWLKAMSLLTGTGCRTMASNRHWRTRFLTIQDLRSPALISLNKARVGGNDDKLRAVFDHYDLWRLLGDD